ncbi:amino acid transporter, putative [Plasmodium ovale]|uniref:Amino acid transporter, putative n=1 Tax=Plasmodium ovale TaxID=36330 RepID=A0A1D3TJ49_PLAOA|nr:amino acid transporter, putative [Plasmodium ovale]
MNKNGIVTNHYNLNKEKGKRTNKGNHKNGKKNDEYRNSLNHGNTSNYLEGNVNNTHTSDNSNIKDIFSSNKKKEKKSKNKKKYSTVGEGNANMGVKYFKTSPYMNLEDNDYGNNCGNHYGNEGSSEVGRSGKRGTQENYNGSNGQVNSDNDNITVVDVKDDKYTEEEKTGEGKKKKNWKRRTFSPFTPGGVRSSTVLFLCTAIGVGFLSIPYVFSKLGIILSILLIFLNAVESYVTTNILCLTSLEHNTFVYGNLLKKIGNKHYKTIIDIGLTFAFLSGYILILILISNFLSSILYVLNFPEFLCNHKFLIILTCLLILPITFREHAGSLNPFLIFSLFSLSITVITIGWQSGYYLNLLNNKEIALIRIDKHFFKCFNILLFSFSQQPNACFITGQFNQPTQRRLTKSAYRSVLLQIIFYTLFGIVGYLSFLDTTKDNIILNYEDTNISILFCKFLLSVTFFFSVPLNFMGSYSSMLSLYLSARNRFQKFYLFIFSRNRYLANLSTLLRDDTANPFEENTLDDITENSSTAESQTEDKDHRKLISICVTIVCALIAFNVKKLSNVIGIGGGITSSLISCLLPNLIYYKNRNNIKSKSKRYMTLAMLCFFSFMGFFSVIITSLILIF